MHTRFMTMMITVLFVALLSAEVAQACTYFFLKTKDGSVISGRTDEFYDQTGSKIDVVPRGISWTSSAPAGATPVSWTSRYGFVAISMFDKDFYGEGMNEKGLATGGLYFEDVKFPIVAKGDKALNIIDAIGWVLGNFQSVTEVKDALEKIKIWSGSDNPLNLPVLPFHFYVTDAAGDSIVVELIEGKLKIWDNRANGVLTNEPDLGWHLQNLRFFSNMNPRSVPLPELNDDKWSLGTGMLGLPGDYTCSGRFVRTSLLKFFAEKPIDAAGGVTLALHLINAVDIPYGPQVWIQGSQGMTQWTIWSVIYDQRNRYFYYRTYENQNVRRIDFSKLDFSQGAERKRLDMFGGSAYQDDTGRFLPGGKQKP